MKMFSAFGKSELDIGSSQKGIGEKRRLFKAPFQQEVRIKKRQNVSLGLPKIIRKDQVSESTTEKPIACDVKPSNQEVVASSTTTSVYKRESTLESRKRNGSSRRVVFTQGTKDWNGLRPDRLYYDELIHQFFVLGKQFSAVDVIRLIGLDPSLVGGVDKLLVNLMDRIKAQQVECQAKNQEDDGVPVLLLGGGRGMKVNSFHLPYLASLQQVVAEAERVVSLGFTLGSDKSQAQDKQQPQAPMIDV